MPHAEALAPQLSHLPSETGSSRGGFTIRTTRFPTLNQRAYELATGIVGVALTPGTSPKLGDVPRWMEESRIRAVEVVSVESNSETIAAATAVHLAGRVAMLSAGCANRRTDCLDGAALAIRCVTAEAIQSGARLVEALTPPACDQAAAAFAKAEFSYLTDLQYLAAENRGSVSVSPAALRWASFSEDTQHLFAEVVSRTYAQTMDFPELTGIRTIQDVLSGHKAAGEFRPSWWQIAFDRECPVGVMLLAYLPSVNCAELVYLGVVPEARGKGVGTSLLLRAMALARDAAATSTVLAVDHRNLAALRLYASVGFRSIDRRGAWITSSRQP